MTGLTSLTLAEARDKLRKREVSAKELASAHLAAIEKANPELNAYITVTAEQAIKQAEAADMHLAAGNAGPLCGIPVAVKDLFCTQGVQTTAGSRMLEGFTPPYESFVTKKLWDAGAVMLGKTNLDEFAMGSANITSYYGPVKSPWRKSSLRGGGADEAIQSGSPRPFGPRDDEALVPGGSSGGSAAAVAANLCLAATGTDTGGSIRQPASFCGIVGFKPTYGRCSRWGIVAFASSLDQAGTFARTVRDAAIFQRAISGFDPMDSTSAQMDVPDFEAALTGDIRGKKVGIPKEYRMDGMNAEVEALWDKGAEMLKSAGAEIVEISLPHTKYALPTYYVIAPAEASSNLARYDGVRYGLRAEGDFSSLDDLYERTRAEGFGGEVKRRILIGAYVLSAGYYDAYYKKAQRVRSLIAQDFRKAYEKVDVILTPTAPSAAFGLNEKQDDPVTMYLNDVFTVPASLAGMPGISVPAGLNADGLPLGLQLIGKPFDEEMVFRAAGVLEEAAQFTAKPERAAA